MTEEENKINLNIWKDVKRQFQEHFSIQSSNWGKVNLEARTQQPKSRTEAANTEKEDTMNLKDSIAKWRVTAVAVGLVVFCGSETDDTMKIADFIAKFELFIDTVGFVDKAHKCDIFRNHLVQKAARVWDLMEYHKLNRYNCALVKEYF